MSRRQRIIQRRAPAKEGRAAAREPFPGRLTPRWDSTARVLYVGDVVVKQFVVPAPMQELVLEAFQEENWPTCIDDPLPPNPEDCGTRRLHNTICGLNRGHRVPLLRFLSNGRAQAVRWEWVRDDPDHLPGK